MRTDRAYSHPLHGLVAYALGCAFLFALGKLLGWF
jgi:hypothetical protein